MLYKILPNDPRAEMDPTKATPDPHADGVIGSAVDQVTISMGKVTLQQNHNQTHTQKHIPSMKVLFVETSKLSNQPDSKKNGKKKRKSKVPTPVLMIITILTQIKNETN